MHIVCSNFGAIGWVVTSVTLRWQAYFDWKMRTSANDQASFLQRAAFCNHGWGHVAVYQSWPHVLLTKLFQPPHNGFIPTTKEQSKIFWRKIGALACVLHLFIQNLKSHAPLQRFAWWFATLVFQLLKPSLKCRLDNSLNRKKEIWFKERLICWINVFRKEDDDWVILQTDYSLESRRKNADSKKSLPLFFRNLLMSRMFYVLKCNMNFCLIISWRT